MRVAQWQDVAPISKASSILLVDDDVRSARLLARLLREDGFSVEVTADGEAAIERLERGPAPTFVVTDLNLPGASGVAVARRAHELWPGVCVIFVTAYPELIARQSPHDCVLGKPLDYPLLTAALAAEIASPRSIVSEERRRGVGHG